MRHPTKTTSSGSTKRQPNVASGQQPPQKGQKQRRTVQAAGYNVTKCPTHTFMTRDGNTCVSDELLEEDGEVRWHSMTCDSDATRGTPEKVGDEYQRNRDGAFLSLYKCDCSQSGS